MGAIASASLLILSLATSSALLSMPTTCIANRCCLVTASTCSSQHRLILLNRCKNSRPGYDHLIQNQNCLNSPNKRKLQKKVGLFQTTAALTFPLLVAKHAHHAVIKPTFALWRNEIWVLTTLIIVIGITFERFEHYVKHSTPKSFKPAISAMFDEFGALGFISVMIFLITHPAWGPNSIFKVLQTPHQSVISVR